MLLAGEAEEDIKHMGRHEVFPLRRSPDEVPGRSGVMCTYDAFTHSGRFVRDLMYLLL